MAPIIGVLALQGDFAEHAAMLRRVGATSREVRLPSQLTGLHGLIIPGGESTTIGRLMHGYDLTEPIRELGRSGLPIWGTCAGLILMARSAERDQPLLGLMDVMVERNAFGRQLESFEADLPIQGLRGGDLHAVFIRAPIVQKVGPDVQILGRLPDDSIVAVQQGALMGTAFHPELTDDTRLHRRFVEMAGTR
jgi:5'-phosphate synthase pdxT subunit